MSAAEVPVPVVITAPQPGSSDRQLLWNTVNRINSNYTHIGKNEKVRERGGGGGRERGGGGGGKRGKRGRERRGRKGEGRKRKGGKRGRSEGGGE